MLDQIGPCEVPDGMASGNVVHLQGQSLQQVSEDQGSAVSGSLTVQSSFCGSQFLPRLGLLKGQPGSGPDVWNVQDPVGASCRGSVRQSL